MPDKTEVFNFSSKTDVNKTAVLGNLCGKFGARARRAVGGAWDSAEVDACGSNLRESLTRVIQTHSRAGAPAAWLDAPTDDMYTSRILGVEKIHSCGTGSALSAARALCLASPVGVLMGVIGSKSAAATPLRAVSRTSTSESVQPRCRRARLSRLSVLDVVIEIVRGTEERVLFSRIATLRDSLL